MQDLIVYHVVSERAMTKGQRIYFDETHHNNVYHRVYEKLEIVKDIYLHPKRYKADELEHHTRVALRELALEKVRKEMFSNYPSRMSCLYVSKSLEEAEKWASLFVELGRPIYSIVKLKINGTVFEGDAKNCFDATTNESENILMAKRYCENLPNKQNEAPIIEILADGEIEVLEIVKEIHANIETEC